MLATNIEVQNWCLSFSVKNSCKVLIPVKWLLNFCSHLNEDYCKIFKFPYFSLFYEMINTIIYHGCLGQHEPCYNKNTWLNFKHSAKLFQTFHQDFQTFGFWFSLRGSKARLSVGKDWPITITEILEWFFWSKGTLIIFENVVCKKQSTFIGI